LFCWFLCGNLKCNFYWKRCESNQTCYRYHNNNHYTLMYSSYIMNNKLGFILLHTLLESALPPSRKILNSKTLLNITTVCAQFKRMGTPLVWFRMFLVRGRIYFFKKTYYIRSRGFRSTAHIDACDSYNMFDKQNRICCARMRADHDTSRVLNVYTYTANNTLIS